MKKVPTSVATVFLLIVSLSGCLEEIKSPDSEIIEISGMNVEQTINYAEKPVKLIVSGMNCIITVTEDTNLTEVEISGVNSIVRVSRSHSFTSSVSGVDSEIIYYD